MTVEFAIRHWSLLAASVLGLAILLFVSYRVYADSARGLLHRNARTLRSRYRDAKRAARSVEKAVAALKGLQDRSSSVKPRHVQEASEALADAQALCKIAEDRVLIAENHVRKVIVEEFPPTRQDAMREKYLNRQSEQDEKPFSF